MSWRLGGGGFYIEEGVLWLRKGCLEHLCHAVSALEGLAVILSGHGEGPQLIDWDSMSLVGTTANHVPCSSSL